MKVTIEGTQQQIEATLMPEQVNHRARKGESRNAIRQKEIADKRRIIRRAFDLVRFEAGREAERDAMLNGLRGHYTQRVLDLAKRIISEEIPPLRQGEHS